MVIDGLESYFPESDYMKEPGYSPRDTDERVTIPEIPKIELEEKELNYRSVSEFDIISC